MSLSSDEYGAIFGVDSKKHVKQWETSDGIIKEFRSNLGVVVNPLDLPHFEEEYDRILDELFNQKQFDVDRNKRVYKSHDIGSLFPMQEEKINAFHLAFTREILKLEKLKVAYCFTRINSKFLKDIKIFGKYGGATRTVDVKSFINILDSYYNVLCGWKVMQKTGIVKCTFIFDGMEGIYPTKAWDELTSRNFVRIVYTGDQCDPVLSTADILVKTLDIFLKNDFDPLNEKTIKKIITYDKKIDDENVFYVYIGNPDIDYIKPTENRRFSLDEMRRYIRRPIIFVSKGSLPGQRDVLENLPIFPKIHDMAYGLKAGIRIYDPKKDSQIIGRSETKDYFLPLTVEADQQFELLKRGGANIDKLKI